MDQEQLIATGAAGDADALAGRVREENPGARELDRMAAAHAAPAEVRHRIWLDEPAGVLLFLEHTVPGNGAAGGVELHQIPLRSASCTRVLTRLMAAVLARLASPADSYRARPEIDRDIGALVQLFRVQLARMRTEHADRPGLVRAIHAQIGRAGDTQQAARRTAFLGWYLDSAYSDDQDDYEQAERDLGIDGAVGRAGHASRAVRKWQWYGNDLRREVPQPLLEDVPSRRGRHWYYEFRTIERHLNDQQMLELRAALPWADVTSESVVLDQWSDWAEHPVAGSAAEIVCKYFDAGLRFSQEGTRTLWLRLPGTLAPQIAPYESLLRVASTIVDDDLVLELHRDEADGELSYLYTDPGPWLEELLPLRADLAGGDLRAVAIAWRAFYVPRPYSEPVERPPMPDGLDEDELTPQLHALIRLLEEIP